MFVKEFGKQFNKNKRIAGILVLTGLVFGILVLVFSEVLFLVLPLMLALFPFLYIYAKAIENSCMIKSVETGKLTEGDWIYENVKVGRKIIRPDWEGLSAEDLKILQEYRGRVRVKEEFLSRLRSCLRLLG